MSETPDTGSGDGWSAPRSRHPLDDLDRAVLHELQLDGRRSFRDIARTIGASEATVRFRVNRLRENGVLQILGFVDPAALGYGVLSSLFLRVRPSATMAVVEAIASWPEAMYVSSTVGRADLFVQIVCEDQERLFRLISERIGSLDGVEGVETLMEVKVHKAQYVYASLE
ncbi:Lrp/AsnC family transcriptional regulator [Nocardioides aquiterrae]|uniref:Lrp/AsnC family transcriptional regulator n=1 Tax=Nocardioides aquiterrae TaxID=203799 RepID=A0ABP4EZD6_9ACTN